MAPIELAVDIATANNLILFLVLVALFVVAYRLLRAVINTAIVAVVSPAVLIVLKLLELGPPVTVDNLILFMVLGTALFIGYSALATAVRTSTTLAAGLRRAWRTVSSPFGSDDEAPRKEKEIVLDEVRDE